MRGGAFTTLVADPPWLFNDNLPGRKRGAGCHYRCMSLEEICAFAMPPLADDAFLVLWRVASMQREALDVAGAWGFEEPNCEIVWVKTKALTRPPTEPIAKRLRMGMGRVTRNVHEVALVCRRGKPKRLRADVPSVFFAPRGRHSEKPDEFYTLIEKLFPGPYVELFARRHRPGWTCMGDEVDG